MELASEKDHTYQWPSEPAVFHDFPTLQRGQSYEDWSATHDAWKGSLSPLALTEVTAYRRDVNKYLRLRTWRKRRELVVGWTVGIVSVILLGAFFDLFESANASPMEYSFKTTTAMHWVVGVFR